METIIGIISVSVFVILVFNFFLWLYNEASFNCFIITLLIALLWTSMVVISFQQIVLTEADAHELPIMKQVTNDARGERISQIVITSDGPLNLTTEYRRIFREDQVFIEKIYPAGWYGVFYFWNGYKQVFLKKE